MGRLGTCRAHDWRPELSLSPPAMGSGSVPRRALQRDDGAGMAGERAQGRDWPWAARASSHRCRQRDGCWGEHEEATVSPTFLLHSCSEALLQPAVSALVSFVFVYHTLPVKPGKKERCEEQQD